MRYHGGRIVQVQGVGGVRALRGFGIGGRMMDAMGEKSRARGGKQVQLSTNTQRGDEQRC